MQYQAECESIGQVLQSRLFFFSPILRVKKIPCRDIEPHIHDSVHGNDNCLFRAFSKEVTTGTESNHQAVRQTILNFMTHKDNAHSFCKDCLPVTLLLHAFMSLLRV